VCRLQQGVATSPRPWLRRALSRDRPPSETRSGEARNPPVCSPQSAGEACGCGAVAVRFQCGSAQQDAPFDWIVLSRHPVLVLGSSIHRSRLGRTLRSTTELNRTGPSEGHAVQLAEAQGRGRTIYKRGKTPHQPVRTSRGRQEAREHRYKRPRPGERRTKIARTIAGQRPQLAIGPTHAQNHVLHSSDEGLSVGAW
jgi:hypothetical protein